MTTNIIFIDSRVANYQSFIDGLSQPAEVFILDANSDGLAQMAADLQGRTGIDAIHVISHGSQGALYLGSTVLDSGNLASYGSQLSTIGSSLAETGDILLYGCNVAQGESGLQFISTLAQYTGADVAASIDTTGVAAGGGNWLLESQTGNIQSPLLTEPLALELLAINTAPKFSSGVLITDFGFSDSGNSMTLQADGKILVAGSSNGDFALARYNINGTLDTTFDGDGKVTTDFGFSDSGNSMTLQADGKILVAGSSNGLFALTRYNTNGGLDTSFSGDGKVSTDVGGSNGGDYGRNVVVQANGVILVAGSSFEGNFGFDFALAGYKPDGTYIPYSLATTDFGTFVSPRYVPSDDFGSSVTIQSDGKILVVGNTSGLNYPGLALARYTSTGYLDETFSTDGKITTQDNFNALSMKLAADGGILIAGSRNGDFALTRYGTGSSLSFSVTTDLGYEDSGSSMAVQADGKILVAGSSNGNFALTRYNASGTLDTNFSTDNTTVYIENSATTLLNRYVHVFDAELTTTGNYAGATLTLARQGGNSDQDVFASGSGTGLSVLTQGSDLSINGTLIGKVTANNGGQLVLTFSNGATQLLVDQALRSISYSNTSDAPPAGVNIGWDIKDGNTGSQGTGGTLTASSTTTVNITAVNDLGNVTISGTNAQGQILSAVVKDADGLDTATCHYQWYADGYSILGATKSAFTLTQAQVGKFISVDATYTDLGGTIDGAASALTSTVVNVNDAPLGVVSIIGSASRGQTLSASNALIDIDGLGTVSYQWRAAGVAISGATDSTLKLGNAQVGKPITVVASYTDGGGTIEAVGSSATTAVTPSGLEYIASYADLIHAFGANAQAGVNHFITNGLSEGRTVGFDGLKYIASYVDLIGAFGANADAGASHYITNGLAEGRTANFDGLKYIASYADLIGAFGTNVQAGESHYITSGLTEGRTATFDGLKYIASYADLIGAFGTNVQAAESHYITNGFVEGRSASFDALKYIASYADLIGAFGTNVQAGESHYSTNGFAEGRTANFDVQGYLAKYADLRATFETDTQAAESHFIQAGFHEGRNTDLSGNDMLTGSAQAETLNGGTGNDLIDGAGGADSLIGGSGADQFIFRTAAASTPSSVVTIADFNSEQGDVINLMAVDGDTASGQQSFHFIGNSSFSQHAGELRFDTTSHQLMGDTNGDGLVDMQILLVGVSDVSAPSLML